MQKCILYLFLLIFFVACKTTYYTGINNPQKIAATKSNIRYDTKIKIPELKTTQPDLIFAASVSNENFETVDSKLDEHISKINLAENLKASETKIKKKLTFKEKLIGHIVQKRISNSNSSTTKPDGFSRLDKKIRVGLILLLVAIGLSIISLGGLGKLIGLIGLIFIILGLLNT